MLKTWAAGGVRCNVRLNEAAGGAMTGTVRGLNHPSGAQLASAGLGSQHAVPAGHGSGWQAVGVAEFNRASMNSNQQVKLEARLVLPNWAGATNAGWNSIGNGCTRGSNQREVNCELWSPPFQNVPYPCPSGKAGVQPGACVTPPNGCTGPVPPDPDTPDTYCPGDNGLPSSPEEFDPPSEDTDVFREMLEEETGTALPGPWPAVAAASGNPNNNNDPRFYADDYTEIHNQEGLHTGANWCNDSYRARRKWCTAPKTKNFNRMRGAANKLFPKNSTAYVCYQFYNGNDDAPKRTAHEHCAWNFVTTGFVKLRDEWNFIPLGECEHFNTKKQWVWCNVTWPKPI